MILDILLLGLEISPKTTTFAMYSKIAGVVIHDFHFYRLV